MRHTVALCCLIAAFAWIASADDTFGTAIDLGTLSSGGQLQATGLSIDPESDVDYFTFELLTESDVTIVTAGDSGGDTVMVLYDGDRQVVAEDDDGGTAAYSKVEEDELASGTYYVEIRVYGKSGAIDDYSVTITASGAQEASSAGSLLTLPGIGTPGEVASSDDKADFLRRVAQAMQRLPQLLVESAGHPLRFPRRPDDRPREAARDQRSQRRLQRDQAQPGRRRRRLVRSPVPGPRLTRPRGAGRVPRLVRRGRRSVSDQEPRSDWDQHVVRVTALSNSW